MSKKKYRIILLALAFLLLITGAILNYNGLDIAWWFVGVAVVIYIIARIFMRDKKPKESSSGSS